MPKNTPFLKDIPYEFIIDLDKLFQSLYEDKISGGITEHNYQMMSRKYEAEQTELEVLSLRLW